MSEKYRKGVFVVVYSRKGNSIEYLVLKRKLHWRGWEFPKGGIDANEKASKTIVRELKEETGLNAIKITKFPVSGKYSYRRMLSDRQGIVGQTFTLYGAEVRKKPSISLDRQEHSGYKWLGFKDALKKLKWPNQKMSLRYINKSLIKGNKNFREIKIGEKTALLGKSQEQNESLVKYFIGESNAIMHTVAPGSPFGVALEDFNGAEKKQLASWVAAYSQDWRDNRSDIKVHIFTGKNVYKDRSMKVGTFGVKNARKMTAKKKDIEKCKKS